MTRSRSLPTDTDDVAAWVRMQLERLDTTPKVRNWRQRAVGMSKGEAIAMVPRYGRLDLRLTVGELRVLQSLAERRGMTMRGWLRAAVATVAVACEGVAATEIPTLMGGGLLGERTDG